MRRVLVDAGPLVALLDRTDAWHARCVAVFDQLEDPMTTTWPAFTEATYLLRPWRPGQQALLKMLESRALVLAPLDVDDVGRIHALMEKYSDLPMDLADATLVRVAERDRHRTVFTVDQGDFAAYRLGRERFEIVP